MSSVFAYCTYPVIIHLRLLWSDGFLTLFLVTLKSFEECTSKVFCKMSLLWDLSDVLLKLRLRLWVFGRKAGKGERHSYHAGSRAGRCTCLTHCWCGPDRPAGGALGLSSENPLPLPLLWSMEGSHSAQPTVKESGLAPLLAFRVATYII